MNPKITLAEYKYITSHAVRKLSYRFTNKEIKALLDFIEIVKQDDIEILSLH